MQTLSDIPSIADTELNKILNPFVVIFSLSIVLVIAILSNCYNIQWKIRFVLGIFRTLFNPPEGRIPLMMSLITPEHRKKGFGEINLLIRKYYVLISPRTVQALLKSTKHIDKQQDYEAFEIIVGTGIGTAKGVKWRQTRKMLNPAFNSKILENAMPVLNKHGGILVEQLVEHLKTRKGFHDIEPLMIRCNLNIICEGLCGTELNIESNKLWEYHVAYKKQACIAMEQMLYRALSLDWYFRQTKQYHQQSEYLKIIHDFSEKQIKERRKYLMNKPQSDQIEEDINSFKAEQSDKHRRVMLDFLLERAEGNNPITDKAIRDEVDTFILAGYEATSCSILWNLFLVGNYPEVQDRIYEEMLRIFGTSTRDVEMDDLPNMKYLECSIKESLRIYPTVSAIARQLHSDLVLDDSTTLEAGSSVVVNQYALHHDPDLYPDPSVFNPDRFLNDEDRHPFAFIPFSAGPRNCIGSRFAMMAMKVILSSIYRKFQIRSSEPQDKIELIMELVVKPKNPIELEFTER